MSLALIIVFSVAAAFLGLLRRSALRQHLLLGASVLAVYALQPALPVRGLDFWLPSLSLFLAVMGWALTALPSTRSWKGNWPALAVLAGLPVLLGMTRHLGLSLPLTASRPPQLVLIGGFLLIAILLVWLSARFTRPEGLVLAAFIFLVLALFLVLKLPALAELAGRGLRWLNGQSLANASPLDLRWLGFSYIAFRLLHTFRDRQSGRLPDVKLGEYVVYLIFFPALSAGPIDRIERFVTDLRASPVLSAGDFASAGRRLVVGLFKKFILADSLALIALNATNALQVRATGWAWVLLYAYAFQIFFDFSGYTDIAIGLGHLIGFQLPENFNAPLRKPNLTQFWNSWHMTLTQWFRAYFFNPVTRFLRTRSRPLPVPAIIFLTQMATMILIGLWHGATWNFVLWGAWHGLGLFVHNRWAELTKARLVALPAAGQKAIQAAGVFLTFQYVALGWVFFALPTPATSVYFLGVLFGAG